MFRTKERLSLTLNNMKKEEAIQIQSLWVLSFPGGAVVKNLPANAGGMGLIPGPGISRGEGNGNPFQYSCQENFQRQRNLACYSPWGLKESDTTEHICSCDFSFHIFFLSVGFWNNECYICGYQLCSDWNVTTSECTLPRVKDRPHFDRSSRGGKWTFKYLLYSLYVRCLYFSKEVMSLPVSDGEFSDLH